MSFMKYYIVMLIEIFTIMVFYSFQGYNYNNLFYNLLYQSLTLLISIKIIILLVIWYQHKYTDIFNNRIVYIPLKLYIILVIYTILSQIGSVIK